MNNLAILHVYGQLGKFALQTAGEGRAFAEARAAYELTIAAKGIHLIPEARGDDTFKLARNWFGWAERICFLGFGFDPLNIDRLNLASVLKVSRNAGRPLPLIYASAVDKTATEVDAARVRLIHDHCNWSTDNSQSSITLRRTNLLTPD